MGAMKIRCPQCGAKNHDVQMCRICGLSLPNAPELRKRGVAASPAPQTETFEPFFKPYTPAPRPNRVPAMRPAPPAAAPVAPAALLEALPAPSLPPPPAPPAPRPHDAAPTRPTPAQPLEPPSVQPRRSRPAPTAPPSPRPAKRDALVVLGTLAVSAVGLFLVWDLAIRDDSPKFGPVAQSLAGFPSTSEVTTTSVRTWTEFEDPDGLFTALLPGEPSRDYQTVATRDGRAQIPLTSYSVEVDRFNTVSIAVYALGPGVTLDPQVAAKAIADQLAGTITANTTTVDEEGRTVLDVAIKVGDNVGRMRVIDARSHIYLLRSHGLDSLDMFRRLIAGFTVN